jgi:hypothetical protein
MTRIAFGFLDMVGLSPCIMPLLHQHSLLTPVALLASYLGLTARLRLANPNRCFPWYVGLFLLALRCYHTDELTNTSVSCYHNRYFIEMHGSSMSRLSLDMCDRLRVCLSLPSWCPLQTHLILTIDSFKWDAWIVYGSRSPCFLDVVGLYSCMLSLSHRHSLLTRVTLMSASLRLTARLRLANTNRCFPWHGGLIFFPSLLTHWWANDHLRLTLP